MMQQQLISRMCGGATKAGSLACCASVRCSKHETPGSCSCKTAWSGMHTSSHISPVQNAHFYYLQAVLGWMYTAQGTFLSRTVTYLCPKEHASHQDRAVSCNVSGKALAGIWFSAGNHWGMPCTRDQPQLKSTPVPHCGLC